MDRKKNSILLKIAPDPTTGVRCAARKVAVKAEGVDAPEQPLIKGALSQIPILSSATRWSQWRSISDINKWAFHLRTWICTPHPHFH